MVPFVAVTGLQFSQCLVSCRNQSEGETTDEMAHLLANTRGTGTSFLAATDLQFCRCLCNMPHV
jgi:hypothetical protein